MSTIDPTAGYGDLGREIGRLVLDVTDPDGVFADPWTRARVRKVMDAVAMALADDFLGRLIERMEAADRQELERFRAGEAVPLRIFPFVRWPVRLDREVSALVVALDGGSYGPLTLTVPLVADLQLTEGSAKGVGAFILGGLATLLSSTILFPGLQESKPAKLGQKYVTETANAAWETYNDAVAIAERALDELAIKGRVEMEEDRLVIIFYAPPSDRD